MNKGTRVLLCIIAVTLIMMAENGIPLANVTKLDWFIYVLIFLLLNSVSNVV